MHILEKIIKVVAPHTCLGCGFEGDRLLCEGCEEALAQVPSRCYRCKAVTDNYETCEHCQSLTPLKQVLVFGHHAGIAKELIHHMKYERAQSGIGNAAELMHLRVPYLSGAPLLVHVPTASSRARTRGYDHARLLARHLARRTSLRQAYLLARSGQTHQVGATRAQRLKQLENALRPLKPELIKGAHIVLVDDVVTTGATLETAARVLKRAGAKRVDAIVFAQAQ